MRRLQFSERYIPEPNSGCWLWTGAHRKDGYAEVVIQKHKIKRSILAHRFSFEQANGSIKDGCDILHKCDVRCCVNPDHLFEGDHFINMRDMVSKGRNAVRRGEQQKNSKLKESDIISIRADKRTFVKIAADYGIATSLVSNIKTYKSWRHVA